MKFHYDKKIDALYLRFNEERYFESDEVSPGIILDYGQKGKIIGLEVLDASKHFPWQFGLKLKKKQLPVMLNFQAVTASSISN
ncbi:MAG: DUF2283 domain-containing protein [Candidatus Vogelbacteria bacterium]|nr:DUF2283 domain-containing protein [Candidatus Vogelbacteria bacterium]